MVIHIGQIIKKLLKEKGLRVRYVADFINISESTLYDIYKRPSIDVDKLIRFSQLLNRNLFLYYLDEEPIKSMFGEEVESMRKRILELESELESRNEKLDNLIEIIDAQKKVIRLYEASADKNDQVKKRNRGSSN